MDRKMSRSCEFDANQCGSEGVSEVWDDGRWVVKEVKEVKVKGVGEGREEKDKEEKKGRQQKTVMTFM